MFRAVFKPLSQQPSGRRPIPFTNTPQWVQYITCVHISCFYFDLLQCNSCIITHFLKLCSTKDLKVSAKTNLTNCAQTECLLSQCTSVTNVFKSWEMSTYRFQNLLPGSETRWHPVDGVRVSTKQIHILLSAYYLKINLLVWIPIRFLQGSNCVRGKWKAILCLNSG
jgi:hypothetical protein